MKNIIWKKSVNAIIIAFVVYTLGSIACDVMETVETIMGGDIIEDIVDTLRGRNDSMSVFDLIGYLVKILVIGGYLVLLGSLKDLSRIQVTEMDENSVMRVRNGYILTIVATLIGFIPIVGGLIALIFYIIAYSRLIGGFKRLANSIYLPDSASAGFRQLRACTIWILVGSILSIIPFIGPIIRFLINFITFFVIVSSWSKIKKNGPEIIGSYGIKLQNYLGNGNDQEESSFKVKRDNLKLTGWLLSIYFFLNVIVWGVRLLLQTETEPYLFNNMVIYINLLLHIGLFAYLLYGVKKIHGQFFRVGCILLFAYYVSWILMNILYMAGIFDRDTIAVYRVLGNYILPAIEVLAFVSLTIGIRSTKLVKILLLMNVVLYVVLSLILDSSLMPYVNIIYAVLMPILLLDKLSLDTLALEKDKESDIDTILNAIFIPSDEPVKYKGDQPNDDRIILQRTKKEARTYDLPTLNNIVENKDAYNLYLVDACKHELEIRENSKQHMDEVAQYGDMIIKDILKAPYNHPEEIVYCCEQEYKRRCELELEAQKQYYKEQQFLIEERRKELKKKIVAFCKKWKTVIIIFVSLLFAFLVNLVINASIVNKFSEPYKEIVLNKHFETDPSKVASIEKICDRVINKPLISRKHKGNAFHLKSYLKFDISTSKPDSELILKALDYRSPLATVDVAMMKLFDDSGVYTSNDIQWAIDKLEKLDQLESDIVLAAYEFNNLNYSNAYNLLEKYIDVTSRRFKKYNTQEIVYDESDCLISVGYKILAILHYYGEGGATKSFKDAKNYLKYNEIYYLTDEEFADYSPKVGFTYFKNITSRCYEIMGDMLLSGFVNVKRNKNGYSYKGVYPYIKSSLNFYKAAATYSQENDNLNNKITIVNKMYSMDPDNKSKWSGHAYCANSSYYHGQFRRKNYGIVFNRPLGSEIDMKIVIGPMSSYWGNYKHKGNCIVISFDEYYDTYAVKIEEY